MGGRTKLPKINMVHDPAQLLESVSRCTQNGFIGSDLDDKVTCFSPIIESLTGWKEEEVIGKDIRSFYFIPEEDSLFNNETAFSAQVAVLFTKDGRKLSFPTRQTEIQNKEGKIDGKLLFFVVDNFNKDIDQLQSEFVSTVSHELRTPITSIKGFASTLLQHKERFPEDKRNKYITIIKEQAERLSRLVEDLLAVSRIDAKKLQFTIHPVQINQYLETTALLIENKYSGSHRIDVEIDKDLPDVWVDADRLEQIFTNLIDNAVKYSPGGEKVIIKAYTITQDDKKMVKVSIRDFGIGIEEKFLAKIFSKFSRLDNPLSRKTEGTGLGLYISHSLARIMNGHLSVESGPEGSTFKLYLPTEFYEVGDKSWD
ncbi:MAG: PAS domain-containing protein [Candidatus Caenarcaniphilales bacterium]|nr:PAS domain-containing protein [Candidatus Caenarcaniphilales bacterium]